MGTTRGSGRTTKALGLVLACAAPFLTGPAGASSREAHVRLSGRGTAFVDISLPGGVRLDDRNARIVVRGGTYAGWWVARIGETPTSLGNQFGSVRWVDPQDPAVTYPSAAFGFRAEPLVAGRYRVYLATDGEATIEVPAPGLRRSLDLRPTRRTTSSAVTQSLATTGVGVVAADGRTPLRLPPHALAVSSVRTVAEPGVAMEVLSACFAASGKGCTGPTTSLGHTSSLQHHHAARFSSIYLPGQAAPGSADAVQRAYGGPGVVRASAHFFYLVTVP